jgi:hypothetical protein
MLVKMLANSADWAAVFQASLALVHCHVSNREYHQPNQALLPKCPPDQLSY